MKILKIFLRNVKLKNYEKDLIKKFILSDEKELNGVYNSFVRVNNKKETSLKLFDENVNNEHKINLILFYRIASDIPNIDYFKLMPTLEKNKNGIFIENKKLSQSDIDEILKLLE